METLTKLYEVRFSNTVLADIAPIMEDIESAIQSGSADACDRGLAEFVRAEHRVVIKRQGNSTYAVDLSVEGVIAFAKEVAYRIEEARSIRTENGSHDRNDYQYMTNIIGQLVTALKNANKALADAGVAPVTSYWK